MNYCWISLLLALSLCTCARAQNNLGFPVKTSVEQGTLEARYSTQTGIQTYLGIPFAAPPVGDLRWRAPQPPAKWSGVRQATEFGPRAIQQYIYDDMRFRSPMASEDCLYLNVWTPQRDDVSELPVLLYYHGGGNTTGSGDELRYDGERLAQQGIVVVTTNYRLGVFGFLAHPALSAEQGGFSGNYGLLDQVAALEWVHANIAAFGGDPNRITIAGESAGSIDVSVLMTSPLSRDLLAGAVGQSGAAINPTFTPIALEQAEGNGAGFFQHAGFSDLSDLREASTKKIFESGVTGKDYNFQSSLVLDGNLLPRSPQDILVAGEQADIPLMVGWTSAEAAWAPAPESAEVYENQLRQQFGEQADSMLQYYPAEGDLHRSTVDVYSDTWIVFSTWKWANLHASTSEKPVFRYHFNRVRPSIKGQQREREPIGAGHATDIEYFMNSLDKSDAYAWEEADRQAAKTMSSYLVNFVKTGNPNGDGLSKWNALGSDGPDATPVMQLDAESTQSNSRTESRYRMLDRYYNR